MSYIVWFSDPYPGDVRHLGGKNASLVTMTAAGMPVPPGFAVTADAYRRVFAESGLEQQMARLLDGLDVTDQAAVKVAGAAARDAVTSVPLPQWLTEEIVAAYDELAVRCSDPLVGVAVRSSATSEDQPDASFAGEHDTYLWVRGHDSVIDHVRRCWASLFTDRAITYRREMGYTDGSAAMSVGVQKMVTPRTAGVAFTLNPTNGDRSQVAIDASWGLGEAVVSGSVTPDNFLVDKVMGQVTSRTISPKHVEHRLGDDGRVVECDVEPERRDAACLSDEEIRAVAALARRAEKHYGCPQDVEWALDAQLPDGENVLLLQARPETVWSRKPRTSPLNGVAKDTFRSIVATLLDGHHTQGVDAHHGHPHSVETTRDTDHPQSVG
ncbi:MAG: phosphoenolpyruvate synthase [Actinobacteria bacterium]|nr:phosphoenolpyruvate synthase [Actinomycetota bacterium]